MYALISDMRLGKSVENTYLHTIISINIQNLSNYSLYNNLRAFFTYKLCYNNYMHRYCVNTVGFSGVKIIYYNYI